MECARTDLRAGLGTNGEARLWELGAMGKDCWLLVPATPAFWLWGRETETTPWYGPNLRLFRQALGEPWSECILRVRAALKERQAKRA